MKQEDRFRSILKEFIELEYEKVSASAIGIFFYGFVFGIIFAYSNLAPLSVGLVGGYVIARQNYPLVNYFISQISNYIMVRWDSIKKSV